MEQLKKAFGHEFDAAHKYAEIGAGFYSAGRLGLAKWAFDSAREELGHAIGIAHKIGEMAVGMAPDDGTIVETIRDLYNVEADLLDFYRDALAETNDPVEQEFLLEMIAKQSKAYVEAQAMLRRVQSDITALDLQLEG